MHGGKDDVAGGCRLRRFASWSIATGSCGIDLAPQSLERRLVDFTDAHAATETCLVLAFKMAAIDVRTVGVRPDCSPVAVKSLVESEHAAALRLDPQGFAASVEARSQRSVSGEAVTRESSDDDVTGVQLT